MQELPPSELADLEMGNVGNAAQDYLLPSMSMDSFLAAIDEQDTVQQRLKSEPTDEFADSFLPSLDELTPLSALPGDSAPVQPGRNWLASLSFPST